MKYSKTLDSQEITTCNHGHDVTDKVKSLYVRTNKQTGKVSYCCRACQSIRSREMRERKGIASPNRSRKALYYSTIAHQTFTATNEIQLNLLKRIEVATETELLEIALFVAKLIPDTEKPE
jgi:hypothetical protein